MCKLSVWYYNCGKEHKRTWGCCRLCPGGRCERCSAQKVAVASLALNRCGEYCDCLVCGWYLMLVNLKNGYSCLLFRTLVTFAFLLSPFSKPFRTKIATTSTRNHSKAGYCFLMLWYHRRRSQSFLSLLGVEQVRSSGSSFQSKPNLSTDCTSSNTTSVNHHSKPTVY
jgi:hypothetical protein